MLHNIKDLVFIMYTAQNKYVCTHLFAFFDVLNWSLNEKVYIILKLVQLRQNKNKTNKLLIEIIGREDT